MRVINGRPIPTSADFASKGESFGAMVDLQADILEEVANMLSSTGISITAGSMTDAIKISGTTPVDGIEISSACSANAINISGASLVGIASVSPINVTRTNPTAADNGIYSLITAGSAWTSGSIAAVRGRTNVTATGACGNVYGGWFGINFASGAPTGLGLSTGLYAQAGSDLATVKVSSVLHACLTGGASANMTGVPLLCLQDNVTGTQTDTLMEVGFNAGGSTVSTGTGNMYYGQTLKMKVNNATRYMMLSTEEGYFHAVSTNPTTALDIVHLAGTLGSNWTGSQAAIRATLTSTATGAIGNARAVMGVLTMTASPSSQGHTAAGYFELTAGTSGKNATSILSLCMAQADGGASTPFIFFDNTSSTKTTVVLTFGGGAGGNLGTAGSGDSTVAFSTGGNADHGTLLFQGLRIMVNNSAYYIPLVAAASWHSA